MNRFAIALASSCLVFGPASAVAQDKPDMSHVDAVTAYVTEHVKPWLSDPALIEAINAETEKHARLNYEEIQKLDQDWKDKAPIVEEIMGNATSEMLKAKMAEAPALTEIFVMDAQGFNVGQTGETSDYYQADEPKWQKTFPAGPDAIFVDVAEDEGGKKIAQASLAVADSSGKPVGAVTVGVDVGMLK
jgi:hypothetical protein